MKNKDVFAVIEYFAPLNLAEEWDKVGLMCGSAEHECSKVAVCLDLTFEIARVAVENGCNLILTHHPFIFFPIERIDLSDTRGKITELLIKNDVTVYSAHTNLDKTTGGVNCRLAEKLGAIKSENDGIGVFFETEPTTLGSFAESVAERLNDNSVKYAGAGETEIRTVYAVCGSGYDEGEYCKARTHADVFLTGDMKHFAFLNASDDGFPLIEVSHFASERCVNDIFADVLKRELPGLAVFRPEQKRPFKMYYES